MSLSVSRLEGLLGLHAAKRAVAKFAEPGSGVHAVLLYGAQGAGKRQVADALAVEWLNPNINGEPSQATTAFENGRNPDVLRVEPIFGQSAPAKREEGSADMELHRRMVGVRKIRDLAVQDVRKLERHLSVQPVELNVLRARIEDAIASAEPDERVHADLIGRLEQIEKHRELLLRHVSKLYALLAQLGDE